MIARVRPSWDEYFMEITRQVARRSTCLRRQVGALIVKDKQILATGYNGAPSGFDHCEQTGCLREEMHIPSGERQEICRGLHAEQNAIIQAALHGVSVAGGDLYCTHQPCITCAKMIINSGLRRVICYDSYPDPLARSFLEQAGIQLVEWEHD
ncbi:MAG: tRNA-specific adenosine deaminase [Chloroflexi bacterium ADurb.Bin180]|nr:MAG: tRNA-specific adenosine deaminase [Chloroflexi bacterium ADurb.Bin180]HOU23320.1 cytidine/deoxycytidylate deaminase family protein [Anaerolineae bacterium]HQJ51289.1 cytidine/deoxycytidylate deaminase family protein [Anaerolineae bacterium]